MRKSLLSYILNSSSFSIFYTAMKAGLSCEVYIFLYILMNLRSKKNESQGGDGGGQKFRLLFFSSSFCSHFPFLVLNGGRFFYFNLTKIKARNKEKKLGIFDRGNGKQAKPDLIFLFPSVPFLFLFIFLLASFIQN